ncbi:MAG: hypothetical protein DHS20C05_16300 [Hyphococcus sp.]|nr:MAG: hypothetical protein DHS20C05_16300 [Marinicaulis sp.]
MKLCTITAVIALILPVNTAVAQNVTANESLQHAAVSDAEDALAALEAGDYALAATRLEQASKNATQLNIRKSFSLLARAAFCARAQSCIILKTA